MKVSLYSALLDYFLSDPILSLFNTLLSSLSLPLQCLDEAVQFFLNANYQSYQFEEKLDDLGKFTMSSLLLHFPFTLINALFHFDW